MPWPDFYGLFLAAPAGKLLSKPALWTSSSNAAMANCNLERPESAKNRCKARLTAAARC
jgi:hypothetical protein